LKCQHNKCIAGEDRERLTKGLVDGRAAAADDCVVETGQVVMNK
jgi:hypothetical protein